MRLNPNFLDCAESALLVDFGPRYDKHLSLSILSLSERLEKAMLAGYREAVPALSSLTIFYDPLELPKERLVLEVKALCQIEHAVRELGKVWEIPVAFGGEGGPERGAHEEGG